MPDVEVVVTDDPAGTAAELIAEAARRGGGVALSGGSTPGPAYARAAELAPDWSGVELWFADERCVPPDDERSNHRLVAETLLAGLAARPDVHRVEGERPPHEAARAYDALLRDRPLALAILGIGSDGHTASLFPGAPALGERERDAVAAEAGLHPFVPRVTMTPRALARCEHAVYLVAGARKADVVAAALAGPPSPHVPASLVRGRRTTAILDPAAASHLQSRPA